MDEARRRKLADTMTGLSELDDVLEAMAALGSRSFVKCYAERQGSRYRWSIAHRGGPYPLLREVARFLDLPHTSLLVGTTGVEGWTVVADPDGRRPDAWTFIEPSGDVGELRTRLAAIAQRA